MAETYTSSKFYGVDISFVFPETIRPANVDLVIGNIAKHIPYPDNKFDYIHQRLLMVGLTSEDWDNVRGISRLFYNQGDFLIIYFVKLDTQRIVPYIEAWRICRISRGNIV